MFAPVQTFDPLTQAQIVDAKAKYVSERETLRLLGYAPEEQTRILDERAADASGTPDAQRTLAETARTRALTQAETAQAPDAAGIMQRIMDAASIATPPPPV